MDDKIRSSFAQKLAKDPSLVARCNEVEKTLKEAATDELEAVDRSERLTSEDFAVYINARADNSMTEDT